jgi:hypothetical protein
MTPAGSKSRNAFTWRVVYAFGVVWIASFLFLSPLARRGAVTYQTTAKVRFAVNPQAALTETEWESMLRRVARQVASPSRLAALRGTSDPSDLDPPQDGEDLLRQMRIGQVSRGDHQRTISIVFLGKGGDDEQHLVNRLASELATEVPRQSSLVTLERWVKANAETLNLSKQVHLAEQIRTEVADLNGRIVQLKRQMAVSDLATISGQMEDLERRKRKLQQDRRWDDSHPEVVRLQNELDGMRTRLLANPEFRPVQIGQSAPPASGETIKNRFFQASETKTPAPTPTMSMLLADLDLSPIGAAATQLKRHAESIADLKRDADAALVDEHRSGDRCAARLLAVDYATRPVLALPPSETPLWLMIVPCLVGSIVALNYNPLRDRMQLQSMMDVARVMHVGIIGHLPSEREPGRARWTERWSARLVRMAEFSLFAITGILIAACMVRPQILSVTVDNPLQALSNWFWLMAG